MGNRLFTNNARSTLASGISNSATSIAVASGQGAKFASPSGGNWQDVTLDDGTNIEIVHLTARSGDTLTVTRAQESTTAVAFSAGAKVEARFTAGAAGTNAPIAYVDLPNGVPGKPRVSTVAYSSSVTLDCSTADVFELTLTGNITIDFSNGVNGQKVEVRLIQDGTGSRTVTWSGNVGFGSDITSAGSTASTGANKRDKYGFEYDSGATKYHMVAMARGY